VALVAEIEEEWIIPVDTALEAVGGDVFRRTRDDLAGAQYDRDLAAFKSEIRELESEASHASGAVETKLRAMLATAKTNLEGAVRRAKLRVDTVRQEADAKAETLKLQLSRANGDVKARIEDRMKRVKSTYHARGVLLSQAWELTKEALAVV
jgi:uncharacterized protein YlxW (UPF0749 family)